MPSGLKRSLSHLAVGLSIPIAALFLPREILLIALGTVVIIVLGFELVRFRASPLNEWFFRYFGFLARKTEVSRFMGASYLFVGGLVAMLIFQRDIAVLALSFMAVGDVFASIIGKRLGKIKFRSKTVEGSLGCFVSCLATGLIFYYAGLDITLLIVLAGSVTATIVEAASLPINDNLTIPLAAGLIMTIVKF